MRCKSILLIVIILTLNSFIVNANNETKIYDVELILITSILIAIISIYSIQQKKIKNKVKIILYLLISIPAILTTFYLVYTTISVNVNSATNGPVHWHSDFEFWACGEKLDLHDPVGFFNRVGTPLYHEHNDNRIHIEGTVNNLEDISLRKFFDVVKIKLQENYLEFKDSKLSDIKFTDCNNEEAKAQAFLYKITNPENTKKWKFKQQKLENFNDYVISPYSQVPPGDCIIIEFDNEKTETSYLCESYKVAIRKGELNGS